MTSDAPDALQSPFSLLIISFSEVCEKVRGESPGFYTEALSQNSVYTMEISLTVYS